MDIEIVICVEVLKKTTAREKHSSFLQFWVSQKNTKAVVVKEDWNAFMKEWENDLKDCLEEVKQPFFGLLRGTATPYREKYADEVVGAKEIELKGTSSEKITQIVNRHYATVQYVVVNNPNDFNISKMKISQDQLLTPKGFFNRMEIKEPKLVNEFLKSIEET